MTNDDAPITFKGRSYPNGRALDATLAAQKFFDEYRQKHGESPVDRLKTPVTQAERDSLSPAERRRLLSDILSTHARLVKRKAKRKAQRQAQRQARKRTRS